VQLFVPAPTAAMGYIDKVHSPTSPVAKLFQSIEPLAFLKERVGRSPSSGGLEASPTQSGTDVTPSSAWFEDFAADSSVDLEKGGGSAMSEAFRKPLPSSDKLHRYTIVTSANADEYHLMTEGLELVMIARRHPTLRRIDFLLPEEGDSEGAARLPALAMKHVKETDEWVLIQPRCTCCAHRPRHMTCDFLGRSLQVARIQHSRRKLEQCSVHYVDVFVPPLVEGESALWCPAWMGKDLGSKTPLGGGTQTPKSSRSPVTRSLSFHLMAPEGADALHLCSKMPAWNAELESLILPFEGRSNLVSSPRNFVVRLADKEQPILQHAQLADNTWCLDFKGPLSVVQAMAIAMASLNWD